MASSLYIEIRGDYSAFEKDLVRVRGIARQNGEAISQALGHSIRPTQAVNNLRRLTEAIRNVGAASQTRRMQAQVRGLQELARFAGVSERQMRSLTRAMQETTRQNALTRSMAELQRQTGYTHRQMAALRFSLGDVRGGFLETAKTIAGWGKVLGGFAVALLGIGKAFTDANIRAEGTRSAFEAITGSAAAAKEELAFIREEADRLGLEFGSTAEAAKTFYAAASNSSLKSQAREIFTAFSEAGTALSLTGEQMNGVFLALGQMVSKGKVSAEEMRKQIGEKLPGAFQMAAEAIGVSTAELDKLIASGKLTAEDLLPKMAKAMHEKFGQAAEDSAHGAQQAVNRLKNAWEDFKTALDGEFCVRVINLITGAVRKLGEAITSINNSLRLTKEYMAGRISFSEMFQLDPDKYFTIDEMKKRRDAAIVKLNEMQADRDRAAKEFFAVGPSQKALDDQLALVASYNKEIDTLYTLQKKKKEREDNLKRQGELRAQQEHESQMLALRKDADDAYAKAMKNNTAFRLAELDKEEKAAIAKQNAAVMDEKVKQQKIIDIQAEYARKRQELLDRENRKASGGAGGRKASSSAGKDITSLEAQINRLRMSGADFKEWELTNVTIPRMLHDFPNATDKVREFYEAQKKAFADEAAKEAQEENKKQMSERARLLKELSELTGDVNMGQEAQNMLLEQQAQAYRETLGPSMQAYIDKWKELQQLRNSDSFADKLKVGFMDSYKTAMDVGSNLVTAANGWADSFASSLASMAENGKVSFSDLAKSIVSDLVKMTTRMMVFWAIGKAIGFFTGSVGETDLGAREAATPSNIFSQGGWAKGGAFYGGTLSRYSSTVVDRPTLFTYGSSLNKFARGAGLMGEAGPEAILPLTRRNGRLGVDASGSFQMAAQAIGVSTAELD